MTRNNNQKSTSIKHFLAIVLAVLMSISLIFAISCKKEETASPIPEYSYSDSAKTTISNPDFVIGTANSKYSSYPKTTVDGWTISKSSSAKSGVVDVSDAGWKELMSTLYNDNGILNYIKESYGFDNDDIKEKVKAEKNYDDKNKVTTTEIKDYIIKNYLVKTEGVQDANYKFVNPSVAKTDIDKKVYMLNNYNTGKLNFGSVQSLTSATEITLEKGQYAKVSAYVKTVNLNDTTATYGKKVGANIRVKNSFNNLEQEDFGIFNISTNGEWKQYSFYIKGDSVYDSKFTVVLGLGYDFYKVEGTAYFDNISVELIDSLNDETLAALETKAINYASEDNSNVKVDMTALPENKTLLYDMSVNFANIDAYSTALSFKNKAEDTDQNNKYYDFTNFSTANGNISNDAEAVEVKNNSGDTKFTGVPYGIENGITIDIKKPSSYSIKLDNAGSDFVVAREKYAIVTFFIKNQLNDLYASNIYVDVIDKFENVEPEQRNAIATISKVSDEWQKCTIFVKNNFDKDDAAANNDNRSFSLRIIVGPNAFTDVIDEYAVGTVQISNPILFTGDISQYANEQDEANEIETPNYNYYKLLSANPTGSTALYAGMPSDYVADEADPQTYSLTVAPSDLGKIKDYPVQPKGFTGIQKGQYKENENAGLINSQYLDTYGNEVKSALNYTIDPQDEKHIQPIMIKATNESYGFYSTKYTVAASAYAMVSVKVRVASEQAKAYVYLVDVSEKEKNIMTFDGFTVNSNILNNKDTVVEKQNLMFEITDKMMGDDGWTTVEFYIAAGASAKNFRVEVWNGDRAADENNTNSGYVFFNDIKVTTSSAFSEPSRYQDAFTSTSSPLSKFDDIKEAYVYQRELSDLEKEYNADTEKKGENVVYDANYIWAKSDTQIYAIYNTIDPVAVDPYAAEETEEEETEEEKETDPATFWLSFSSILMGVALVIAIIMLVVKNVRRRRKANASDAKSHYKVTSRTKKAKSDKVDEDKVSVEENNEEEVSEIVEDQPVEEQAEQEETLDDYVYGDVQNFGEEESIDEQATDKTDEQSEEEKKD